MNLREYLDTEGIAYKTFAKKLDVSHTTMYKLLKEDADPSLSFMIQVQKLTRGQVKIQDWKKQYEEYQKSKE